MRRILLAIGCVAAILLTRPSLAAPQPQAARPKVLAFFTPSGEVHVNYGHGDRIYSTPPLPTMIDNILRWLLSR
jgi:hypothetical protein